MKKRTILLVLTLELVTCLAAAIDLILSIPIMIWNVLWSVIWGIRLGDMRLAFNTVFGGSAYESVCNFKRIGELFIEIADYLKETEDL